MVTIQSMIKYLIQLMFLLCCEKSWNLTPTKKVVHILQNELVSASNLVIIIPTSAEIKSLINFTCGVE